MTNQEPTNISDEEAALDEAIAHANEIHDGEVGLGSTRSIEIGLRDLWEGDRNSFQQGFLAGCQHIRRTDLAIVIEALQQIEEKLNDDWYENWEECLDWASGTIKILKGEK